MATDEYLAPAAAAALIPNMTVAALSQLRYRGVGPTYLRPGQRRIFYRRSDIERWLDAGAVEEGSRAHIS